MVDRFLVKGTQVIGMVAVHGRLSPSRTSSPTPLTPSKNSGDLFTDNYHPHWFSSSPNPSNGTPTKQTPTKQTPPLYEVPADHFLSSGSSKEGGVVDQPHPLESSDTGDEEQDVGRLVGGDMVTYSTPKRDDDNSVLSYGSNNYTLGKEDITKIENTFMWVISDTET